MKEHGSFLQKDVSMVGPSGKEWLVKYGWHAHFQNSRGYFIIGLNTFVVDNELNVDNKLLFTITSPSNIIVKVFGTVETMSNVDDKANKNDYENEE
jgi:hypothetical protein